MHVFINHTLNFKIPTPVGGNLSQCFVRVWSLGDTQTCLFGFLFLWPWGS